MNPMLWAERFAILFHRELKMKISYRMTLVLSATSSLSGLLVYGLLGNSASASITSQSYNMSLASYLVSGVAFSGIIMNGPAMFSQHASPSELEEVLVTPTGFREFILSSSALNILTTIGGALVFFVVGALLLGLDYSYNLPLLTLMVVLGLLASIGLGFMSLGLRLIYKQASLISWIFFSLTGVLGNMIVPVQILPGFAQSIAYLTPQYYFFTGIRMALGSDAASAGTIVALFGAYALALVLLGLIALDYGMRFIRRNGTHRWV
jgi:ABC-type multidrug transport system permease subunit